MVIVLRVCVETHLRRIPLEPLQKGNRKLSSEPVSALIRATGVPLGTAGAVILVTGDLRLITQSSQQMR
jgi:hypothetical protein